MVPGGHGTKLYKCGTHTRGYLYGSRAELTELSGNSYGSRTERTEVLGTCMTLLQHQDECRVFYACCTRTRARTLVSLQGYARTGVFLHRCTGRTEAPGKSVEGVQPTEVSDPGITRGIPVQYPTQGGAEDKVHFIIRTINPQRTAYRIPGTISTAIGVLHTRYTGIHTLY